MDQQSRNISGVRALIRKIESGITPTPYQAQAILERKGADLLECKFSFNESGFEFFDFDMNRMMYFKYNLDGNTLSWFDL